MWNNLLLAFSFFTTLKVPERAFVKENYRYLISLLSVVGVVIGILGYLLLLFLKMWEVSLFLKAVVITIYFPLITGGLHLDGLLDTADAYFSRRDFEKKLEIMHDSRIGAFACLTFGIVFTVKIALIRELLIFDVLSLYLLFIPVFSRVFAALMICVIPFCSTRGLASMYSDVLKPSYKYFIIVQILFFMLLALIIETKLLWMALLMIIFFFLFRKFTKKNFGGITGDILGAFIELSEVFMLFVLVVLR